MVKQKKKKKSKFKKLFLYIQEDELNIVFFNMQTHAVKWSKSTLNI